MNMRRALVLFGTVVVLMAGLARVFASIYTLEMGMRNEGRDDFRGAHEALSLDLTGEPAMVAAGECRPVLSSIFVLVGGVCHLVWWLRFFI
jgi:hypothetical protein